MMLDGCPLSQKASGPTSTTPICSRLKERVERAGGDENKNAVER
jgi:hypothetical protein